MSFRCPIGMHKVIEKIGKLVNLNGLSIVRINEYEDKYIITADVVKYSDLWTKPKNEISKRILDILSSWECISLTIETLKCPRIKFRVMKNEKRRR